MSGPSIVWFRHDLRLADNPALTAAAGSGPIVALFILDEASMGAWRYGGASRWWLHHSLKALAQDLTALGVPLVLRRGPADLVLAGVVADTSASAVYWNRLYEPWAVRRDSEIKTRLRGFGLKVENFNASLLFEPTQMRNGKGECYRVFTPFWKAALAAPEPKAPLSAPTQLQAVHGLARERLEEWRLLPTKPDWAIGLRETWHVGETAAIKRLHQFAVADAAQYGAARDDMGRDGVSHLSPHLRFGEISPRQVWHEVRRRAGDAAMPFLRQLGWREFCHHLLLANPHMPDRPLDPRFELFPWREDSKGLTAWKRGLTGYPLVDAAMRELWRIGYMHNRARLVVGSFLVKHLLLPWQDGEAWFWHTLVDADLANNSGGWQWVAGCGADAAPYFRVFNPVLQGEKFDPDGAYVRRNVPELASLDSKYIHRPWEAPETVLRAAGVRLGETYPFPIVDHAFARTRALGAYETVRSGGR
jgi:deoxyribodipyrimidine photo-lyase